MMEIIQTMVAAHIPCEYIVVDGDGVHFELTAVSDQFANKNMIARHRMVYEALGDKMKQEIHALSMKLYTVAEWQDQNK
jgi:acid stress-induced BolA-like protein IbaG/YrbA